MNPTVIKFAQFVAKRPSDATIRVIHVVTGLVIVGILYWAQGKSIIDIPFYGDLSLETSIKVEYWLMILAVFFIFRGLISACIIKHKWLRWKQGLHGLLLIIVGGPMMDPLMTRRLSETTTTNGFVLPNTTLEVASWHPGIFLVLIGIIWIFIGLTGKGTTSKCLRYGEVVKTIRV